VGLFVEKQSRIEIRWKERELFTPKGQKKDNGLLAQSIYTDWRSVIVLPVMTGIAYSIGL
jgi:hypothetical protein